MYFKNDKHRELYNEFMTKMGSANDKEHVSFCYLCAATGKKVIGNYISSMEGVDYKGLCEKSAPWSSSEKALLELAYQLFDGSSLFSEDNLVSDIFWPLDGNNVAVVLLAMKMRYQG